MQHFTRPHEGPPPQTGRIPLFSLKQTPDRRQDRPINRQNESPETDRPDRTAPRIGRGVRESDGPGRAVGPSFLQFQSQRMTLTTEVPMTRTPANTLRLVMPQWQGGDEPAYRVGAKVLEALLPDATGPVATIPVPLAATADRAPVDGIKSRVALVAQLDAAVAAIADHAPEAILTVGGDCLVDLAPIAYLSETYGDDLAVLWIDAHPDVMNKSQFSHAHAHVLAMLLGDGDADFTKCVTRTIDPARVLYVGVNDMMEGEAAYLADRGMTNIDPAALRADTGAVTAWLKASGATKVAVHFDLDVLSPAGRDYLLFNNPHAPAGAFDGIATGKLELDEILTLLRDVGATLDIVGLAITEFLPWGMIDLSRALAALPLAGGEEP
ncbi:arginase family protein [Pseudooceanicola nanhaiensis]|nr:arginase family protein [Pseudooceanicola nanhaiensis]